MGQCKKDVTPLRLQWSYVFIALTHRYNLYLCVKAGPVMVVIFVFV